MALASNIVRRSGSKNYYARISVPVELREQIGRDELWKSLGTPDKQLARTKGSLIVANWHAEFSDLRNARQPRPASDRDVQMAVWQRYVDELAGQDATRQRIPTSAEVDSAKRKLTGAIQAGEVTWNQDPLVQLAATIDLQLMANAAADNRASREIRKAAIKRHLMTGETALIAWAADDVIARDRLQIAKGSAAYRALCEKLLRAELAALDVTEQREQGNFAAVAHDPIVVPPDPEGVAEVAEPGETIMELYDRYARERAPDVSADTWKQNRKIVQLFSEFVGEKSHISVLTRRTVRNWKVALQSWPLRAADTEPFKGLSFNAVVELNKVRKKPVIGLRTTNRYIAALGGFADWLFKHDYISEQPTAGMYLAFDKRAKKRFPFDAEQLKAIFHSPLFTGCKSDDELHKPGKVRIRDWRFWIMPILGFTGARPAEIAQMHVADVRPIHDTWVFHITEEAARNAPSKSTKTAGSQRVVPIHSELIKMGFLGYVEQMRAAGQVRLFEGMKEDARGFISGPVSHYLNRYLQYIGVKADKSQSLYSFRHGVADALRAAGYYDEMFGPLLGHSKATTTGIYGVMPQGPLADRVKMIEAIRYPGLDLSHLCKV